MTHYVYIAVSGEKKVLLFAMDPGSGKLTLKQDIDLGGGPSPMCMDPHQEYLYIGLGADDATLVASFRIDLDTGGLTRIGTVELEAPACYLATDNTGNFLFAAYYGAGIVTVHPIGDHGAAHGPAVDRHETAPRAHYIETDATNRYAFVPHVAESNAIFQFHFDENSGKLSPNAIPKVDGGPGQGPRHLAFHPNKDIVYADNEQESSVTVYRFNTSNGTLAPDQTLSTLPDEGFDGENSNAQIRIHPTGKAVYASNRGHDSIAIFAIDPDSGAISSLGQQKTESVPRPFNLDPDGNFLFAGGQATGRVASYRIDGQGSLEPLEVYEVGKSPSWVLPVKFA